MKNYIYLFFSLFNLDELYFFNCKKKYQGEKLNLNLA